MTPWESKGRQAADEESEEDAEGFRHTPLYKTPFICFVYKKYIIPGVQFAIIKQFPAA